MKRSALFAGVVLAMSMAGSGIGAAAEVDPNLMNRYPVYNEPFRGMQSNPAGLEQREAAPRFTAPHAHSWSYGQSADRAGSAVSGGGY